MTLYQDALPECAWPLPPLWWIPVKRKWRIVYRLYTTVDFGLRNHSKTCNKLNTWSHQEWSQVTSVSSDFTFPQSSHLKGLSPLGPTSAISNGFIMNQDQRIEQVKLHKIIRTERREIVMRHQLTDAKKRRWADDKTNGSTFNERQVATQLVFKILRATPTSLKAIYNLNFDYQSCHLKYISRPSYSLLLFYSFSLYDTLKWAN